MVRRKTQREYPDVPARVLAYDPKLHGCGSSGIRQWKVEALAYLADHPDAILPCAYHPAGPVSSIFGVLLTTRDLLMAEW